MILVDASAWIQHLRRSDAVLVAFLQEQRVRACDVVIGELLLGSGLPAGFARDLACYLVWRVPSPPPRPARSSSAIRVRLLEQVSAGLTFRSC